MKTTPLKIGKRSFALAFTMDAMAQLQDIIPDFDLNKVADYVRNPRYMVDLVAAMAQQGELLEGRVLDVDRAWFGSHIAPSPKRIALIQVVLFDALADGIRMEEEEDEAGEIDEALEQLKKKWAKGGSPGDGSSTTA